MGPLQLCAGQSAGVEAAVHAMRQFFEDDDSDGILLIDADNAFNRVNRAAVLWNVQYVCPSLKCALINTQLQEGLHYRESQWLDGALKISCQICPNPTTRCLCCLHSLSSRLLDFSVQALEELEDCIGQVFLRARTLFWSDFRGRNERLGT